MTRSFQRGPFQPTLEHAFAAFVGEVKARDALAEVHVLVPSHLLGLHLRRVLAADRPHLNVRFETLDDAAQRLTLERREDAGLRLLPTLAFERLVGELARDVSADSYFGPVRDLPGFAPRLAATIRDVRDAEISSDELLRTLDDAKAREFGARLAALESTLANRRFLDSAALFGLADEVSRNEGVHTAPLVVYGFYDFTAAQWRLVERLIQRERVLVLAPIVAGPAGRFGEPLLARLRKLGFSECCGESSGPCARDIERLHASWLGRSSGSCVGDGSVRLLAPRFRGEEPRSVVRQIDQWVGEGSALSEIGVLYRRREQSLAVERELRMLEQSLAGPEIPVFVQGGVPLASRRCARAITALVAAIDSRFDRRTTFAYWDEIGVPRVHALDRKVREAGVLGRKGIAEWQERLTALDLAAGRGRFENVRDEDDGIDRSVPRDHETLRERIAVIAGVEERLAAATTHRQAVGALVEAVAPAFSAADQAALAEVAESCGVLDDLGLVYDRTALATTLADALGSQSESTQPFGQGIFVGGILGARGLSFERVILPTLEEGVFPRSARQDPILLDAEREAITRARVAADRPGLAQAARSADEERLLFALACGAARQTLVLSCARREDASEKEVAPSSAWRDSLSALSGENGSSSRPWSDPRFAAYFATSAPEPLDAREFDRRVVADSILANDPLRARFIADLDPCVLSSLRATRKRGLAKQFTEFDAVLPTARARELLESRVATALSATRLEDYARCPFLYFASEVLEVDRTDPREEDELDFRFRGTILHAALQHYLTDVVAQRRPWPPAPEAIDAELAELARYGREELQVTARAIGLIPVLELAAAHGIEDDLRMFLETESQQFTGFRPYRLERSFGFGEQPQFVLEAGGRRMEFKGKIDRIDLDPARAEALVVDYKSGVLRSAPKGLEGGRRLQLPIYAAAARTFLPKGTRVVASEYYYFTRRGGGKRVGFTTEQLGEDGQAQLARTVATLAEHIASGVFFADPSDSSTCEHCGYSLACGKGVGLEARFLRKQGDPAMSELMALRDKKKRDEDSAEEAS